MELPILAPDQRKLCTMPYQHKSRTMQAIAALFGLLEVTKTPLLIVGEDGCGKSVIASECVEKVHSAHNRPGLVIVVRSFQLQHVAADVSPLCYSRALS